MTPYFLSPLFFHLVIRHLRHSGDLVLQHDDPGRKGCLENTNRAQPSLSSTPITEAANEYTLQTHDRGTSTSSSRNQVKVREPNGLRVNASLTDRLSDLCPHHATTYSSALADWSCEIGVQWVLCVLQCTFQFNFVPSDAHQSNIVRTI